MYHRCISLLGLGVVCECRVLCSFFLRVIYSSFVGCVGLFRLWFEVVMVDLLGVFCRLLFGPVFFTYCHFHVIIVLYLVVFCGLGVDVLLVVVVMLRG